MKEDIKYKLNQIENIWNNFILEYQFCKSRIKFTPEVKTNYLGDILGYFQDTFDIIFDQRESNSYSARFSNNISLLQSVYVQQDFIEELLIIFKCGIDKGDLKKNMDYSINREIRNELVGHPIRKLKGQLISSCLFGYDDNDGNKISYLRYHKDNDYKFESMEFEIEDIVLRHRNFLNKYFDLILKKLNSILTAFKKKIEHIESLIDNKSFEEIISLLTAFYESIFKYNYIYDKESLLKIYSRKEEHDRYQHLINKFFEDLKSSLREKKEYLIEVFEPKKISEFSTIKMPPINIKFVNTNSKLSTTEIERPVTYHYELGKLASKRDEMDFSFFSRSLRNKCMNNKIVINELNHMESNINNDLEYYTAYRLICTELKED
jgi:hypothetical protein